MAARGATWADVGLRRGEIMNLRWEDVDFNNNQLYISPNKTEYYRYVPMTESLRNALQRAKIGAESDFVIQFGRVTQHRLTDGLLPQNS